MEYKLSDTLIPLSLCHVVAKIDWTAPISSYLKKEFSKETADRYGADIRKLVTLRADAARVADSTEGCRSVLIGYYRALEEVRQILPLNPSDLPLTYSWYDAIDARMKFSSNYVEAEMIAVLHNLAATYSHAAVQIPKNSDDNLKQALKNFKQSACIFRKALQMVDSHPQIGPLVQCLSPDYLSFAENLMLAQGQEVFLQLQRNSLSAAAKARVMAHNVKLYERIITLAGTPTLTRILDVQMMKLIYLKKTLFAALAQAIYADKAKQDPEQNSFGEQVGRLKLASEFINVAVDHVSKLNLNPATLLPVLSIVKRQIDKEYQKAHEDNSKIYFQSVITPQNLANIEQTPFLNVEEPEFLKETSASSSSGNWFTGLVSRADRAILSAMVAEAQQLVTEKEAKFRDLTTLAQNGLKEMGLPGAVTATLSPDQLPLSLKRNITTSQPIAAKVLDKEGHVGALKEQCLRMLDEITASLNEVDKSESEYERQYGPNWQNQAIRQGWRHLTNESVKLRTALSQADDADNKVKAKLDAHRSYISDIKEGPEAVEQRMPNYSAPQASAAVSQIAEQLRRELEKIGDVFERRTKALESAKRVSSEEEIRSIFKQGKSAVIGHVEAALGDIESTAEEQIQIMSDIRKLFHQFDMSRPKGDASSRGREEALSEVQNAIKMLKELEANFNEGEAFYSKLMNKMVALGEDVASFKKHRHFQVSEFLNYMQSQFSYGGGYQNQPPTAPGYR
ncbi:hypothetical protein RCL1_001580 [Eukaryota sp. TZLM3-RCL]